jgi:hypothetical protein
VIVALLTAILVGIAYLIYRLETFMATAAQALTDLTNAVTTETTLDQSVLTLIQNLLTQIQAANGVSPAAVEALVATMQANASGLAAAVTANTPAPPAASSAS